MPGDYNGDGSEDFAVFRPSTGTWLVRNQFAVQFGDRGDVPVPGDFDGDGRTDVAGYRPSTGNWSVHNQFSVNFGGPGHVPVVGDYNGDGIDDVAVFQRSTGIGRCAISSPVNFGDPGDRPVPATTTATARPISPCSAVDGSVVRAQPIRRAVRRSGQYPGARATTTATAGWT